MKSIINQICCLLLIFLLCNCDSKINQNHSQKDFVQSEDDEKQLRYLKEVEWPKAYASHDTVLLDRILGDDFKMIDNSGGWYNKRDELDWIKKNKSTYDSFYYEIKRLDILDNGTAVVCGTGHIFNDSTKSIYQSSNVLVKRDSLWKAILSHVSGYKKSD